MPNRTPAEPLTPPESTLPLFSLEPDPPAPRPSTGTVKNFVLDTNVLLHDPHCWSRFQNNHVFIPVEALSEMDRFKNEQSERGANARLVHRTLGAIFSQNPDSVTSGAPTPGGGTVRIYLNPAFDSPRPSASLRRFKKIFPDQERMDHRIMAACLTLRESSQHPTILVTKDLNMRLKALALGLECEDYLNDKVAPQDARGDEMPVIPVAQHELQRFASSRSLTLPEDRTGPLEINQYALLQAGPGKVMPARHTGSGEFVRLRIPSAIPIPQGINLKPANPGQQCFLDALLNPDIALITCYGQAGTGKTLLAVAAGLHLVLQSRFTGLTVSRPVVAMGDTLGFLPGTLAEKMHPWLQSIYDAFEVLLPPQLASSASAKTPKKSAKAANGTHHALLNGSPLSNGAPPAKPHEKLIERGLLEIEALCYIRGRSIPNRFFVLDEAQQLTPLEAKTVVTRMSRGSKLVMVGDPGQIDNPYVDSRSNGLVFTRNRLRNQALTAHICLTQGERSPLAEMGARMM